MQISAIFSKIMYDYAMFLNISTLPFSSGEKGGKTRVAENLED